MRRFSVGCGRQLRLMALVALLAVLPLPAAAAPADMVCVSGGSFSMGRDGTGDTEFVQGPAHPVVVGSFCIGRYDVTFDEYDAFCRATGRALPGDRGWGRGDRPVINVSWFDAIAYCNWRSREEGLTPAYSGTGDAVACNFAANGYRLPTEAEWEYAARGGALSHGYRYSGSDDITAVGLGYGDRTHPVALKQPNELGIYGMSGNVWQWCWDWYDKDYYAKSPAVSPKGPDSGVRRSQRGGDFVFAGGGVNVFDRRGDDPSVRDGLTGFRLAKSK